MEGLFSLPAGSVAKAPGLLAATTISNIGLMRTTQ